MERIPFTKGKWEDRFFYSKSYRFDQDVSFTQESDCIANRRSDAFSDGFEYVNIFAKEPFPKGTKIGATMLFEEYGAPMISFCAGFDKDADGNFRHGDYYEVVIYNKGVNVWSLYKVGDGCKWHKLAALEFPLAENVRHELFVEFLPAGINVSVGDKKFYLRIDGLPDVIYAGVAACEQINRIYDFTIRLPENK